MADRTPTAKSKALPADEDFFSKKHHSKASRLAAETPDTANTSALNTPNSEMMLSSDVPSTPLNGRSTPDSEGDTPVATSTVTTTISTTRGSGSSTVEFQHIGAKGLSHRVGKDGAVYLKPVAATSSKGRKKMRAVVSFKPRTSHFDRFNETSSRDQFRGFFTLFWVCLALFVLNTSYTSFASTGQVLSMTFATLFSRDAWMLALSDGVLIGSLFICVPFANVCRRGWVRYWPTAVVFQHLWQTTLLGIVIKWARYREWPWVQSGFFVLHTLSMMMKIHSYMNVNGNMADTYHRMRRVESMLEERVAEVEGSEAGRGDEQLRAAWGKAVKQARQNAGFGDQDTSKSNANKLADWSSLETQRGSSSTRCKAGQALNAVHENDDDEPKLTVEDQNATKSDEPATGHSKLSREEHIQLHKKVAEEEKAERSAAAQSDNKDDKEDKIKINGKETSTSRPGAAAAESHPHHTIRDPHPLSSHPDTVISDLAREIEVLREDLLSARPSSDVSADLVHQEPIMWPANVTYSNFWDYLLVPTLVYELSYPRLKTIRPLYVLEKTLATFGTFLVIYVITEHWIMPFTPTADTPFLRTFLQLAVPMMINYLLIFYIMFECICNAFAEITRFADREFYLDWWNATSMDVFSRKWNKPVHSFLLRHVYASTIAAWGLNKSMAMFLTFLLSSLVHELVMAIVSGKIRFYLFAAQMVQLPMIFLSQVPFIKRNETLGNMIFWIGLMAGFPLLNIGYLVY
ncbi:Membrane bound O-acyl transferase, MBOAT [Kalmanozyma brasiliensis GHG001]|uniref:O-acyltransferase n=1 Tax=Kalmanozyma brasiliensis (strain GHG001) TaxID=1365824 RepID=V5GMI3_KALBG|nr:Membrane bound O-acyl transferase, MBOAT [Kalmanozyma brasiliensis GHG001]EST07172.1 Membrane bound O-acyl transferase, MBOAT [Kalmanozyma brasiliensis GHG001]